MKQKEISAFSYGILAALGAGGVFFSLLSANGSAGGAAVSSLFAVLGIAGIVRSVHRKKEDDAVADPPAGKRNATGPDPSE